MVTWIVLVSIPFAVAINVNVPSPRFVSLGSIVVDHTPFASAVAVPTIGPLLAPTCTTILAPEPANSPLTSKSPSPQVTVPSGPTSVGGQSMVTWIVLVSIPFAVAINVNVPSPRFVSLGSIVVDHTPFASAVAVPTIGPLLVPTCTTILAPEPANSPLTSKSPSPQVTVPSGPTSVGGQSMVTWIVLVSIPFAVAINVNVPSPRFVSLGSIVVDHTPFASAVAVPTIGPLLVPTCTTILAPEPANSPLTSKSPSPQVTVPSGPTSVGGQSMVTWIVLVSIPFAVAINVNVPSPRFVSLGSIVVDHTPFASAVAVPTIGPLLVPTCTTILAPEPANSPLTSKSPSPQVTVPSGPTSVGGQSMVTWIVLVSIPFAVAINVNVPSPRFVSLGSIVVDHTPFASAVAVPTIGPLLAPTCTTILAPEPANSPLTSKSPSPQVTVPSGPTSVGGQSMVTWIVLVSIPFAVAINVNVPSPRFVSLGSIVVDHTPFASAVAVPTIGPLLVPTCTTILAPEPANSPLTSKSPSPQVTVPSGPTSVGGQSMVTWIVLVSIPFAVAINVNVPSPRFVSLGSIVVDHTPFASAVAVPTIGPLLVPTCTTILAPEPANSPLTSKSPSPQVTVPSGPTSVGGQSMVTWIVLVSIPFAVAINVNV